MIRISLTLSTNQSFNPSLHPSIHYPLINQSSIHSLVNQSINQPINQSIHQPRNVPTHFAGANEFSFHSNLQNWTESQRICESMNGRLAIIADEKKQKWIGKSVGPFDHWVGARCRKYSAFSSFFWITPNGTRLAFLQPQGLENYTTEVCDGEEAGMVFSSTGFEDETLDKLRPFICQYSR